MRFIVFKQALLVWVAALVCPGAFAAPPFEPPAQVVVSPLLEREGDPDVVRHFENELAKALRLVHELPPNGRVSPFAAGGQSPCRPAVYITTSQDTWVVIQHVPASETTTVLRADTQKEGCREWMQSYLMDRIFFDAQKKPKPGAFLDLVTAAAYQNYGVLPVLLGRGMEILTQPVEILRLKEAAVSATIAFLERLRVSAKAAALSPADRDRLPVLLRQLQTELLSLRCRFATQ